MDPSPLTQQIRPESFQPKVVELYRYLFNVRGNAVLSEGFWREFFLLPPATSHFRELLESLTADDILQAQERTQMFFARATTEARRGISPQNHNALENLTAFLGGVLSKKYTNPSSDVIVVVAGLDRVDKLVSELADGLEDIIRSGSNIQLRSRAVETALAWTAGAYQTGLISYLTHRDLFPALMKYARDLDDASDCFAPLLLLGLLANYNKFEAQNPYQNRLEDFVNEKTIQDLVRGIAHACTVARDCYIAVHDDVPERWNLNTTLAYVGLRALTPESQRKKVVPSEEESKELFDKLPTLEASISLPTYSFVYSNKLFASTLISLPQQNAKESPFAVFLSFSSYLSQHAFRSQRCLHYTLLYMLTIHTIIEDSILVERLSSDELKISVRLCRQRPPHPPVVASDRIPASIILDICTDTISHNLRRRLDIPLHNLSLGTILRLITHLSRNKTRLSHHWSYLWGTLFSFLRFLNQYATDLTPKLPTICHEVCSPLTNLIAFCLSAGDTFLPNPSTYDDLFYKLIETGSDLLIRFRDAYYPQPPSTSTPPSPLTSAQRPVSGSSSIDVLISISTHYQTILETQHGKKVHQSPATVHKVITQGYETLNIDGGEGLGNWSPWREGSGSSDGIGGWNWKGELKRIVRTAVEDGRKVAAR